MTLRELVLFVYSSVIAFALIDGRWAVAAYLIVVPLLISGFRWLHEKLG